MLQRRVHIAELIGHHRELLLQMAESQVGILLLFLRVDPLDVSNGTTSPSSCA